MPSASGEWSSSTPGLPSLIQALEIVASNSPVPSTACPLAVTLLSGRNAWQISVYPAVMLTMVSCTLITLVGFVVYFTLFRWRFQRRNYPGARVTVLNQKVRLLLPLTFMYLPNSHRAFAFPALSTESQNLRDPGQSVEHASDHLRKPPLVVPIYPQLVLVAMLSTLSSQRGCGEEG